MAVYDSERRNLFGILVYLMIVVGVGMFGYYLIEDGWSLFDAFYMTAITITTVGFGEVHKLSPAGQAFTVLVIVMGFGIVALAATQLTRFVVGRELKGVFGRKKMIKKIQQMSDHYILCGFGNIAQAICLKLWEYDVPFVVVDSSEDAVALAAELDYPAIAGDPTKDTTLIMAGIEKASGIVAGLVSDADNLYITLAARELNPNIHIITRGNDSGVEERMLRAGADTVVYPMKLGGQQIARLISQQKGLHLDVDDELAVSDPGVLGYYLRTYRPFENENISVEAALEKMNAMQPVALKKSDGVMLPYPEPQQILEKDDILIMLVNDSFAADAKALSTDPATVKKAQAWSDALSVGILSIDDEHRQILGLINRLDRAIAAGRGKQVMSSVFDDLIEYTATHFRHEEKLFDEYEYPEREAHREEHRKMTKQVLELNQEKKYIFPANVSEFLAEWLKNHILGTDKKYAEFLRSKGVL